jgi:iron(II)-dependent oxidoreductase
MIRIPSDWFWMGSDAHFPWEKPRHRVFTDAFEIATTPVQRAGYAIFLKETDHQAPRGWTEAAFSEPDQPVVGVSWFDALAYCRWLSETTGASWRLPTEAEWERASKGGDDTAEYAWGNEPPESFAYYRGEWPAPRPVGQSRPNGFGLFNMGDNVHEWCRDWYAPDYYAVSPELNPEGPPSGTRRVSRGGSWRHAVKASRAAHRSSLPPQYRYTDYGFRLVRSVRGDQN